MLNTQRALLAGALFISINSFSSAQAAETGSLHDSIINQSNVSIEGGFTAIAQITDDNRIEDEITTSFDLLSSLTTQSGEWVIYIEGNKTPRANGVSSILGEANADSGSALDRDGKGRLQISELLYNTILNDADLTIGMLDVTGFLDASDIANDETSQFLAASLVNNPSIEFPDYVLGARYHRDTSINDLSYTFVLSSSHGLADNTNVSYSELVDLGATGKGIFAAAEFSIPVDATILTAGLWLNTGDHQNLNGSGNDKENNSGIYFVIDSSLNNIKWNLRYGLADDSVSEIDNFIGIATEFPIDNSIIGIGYSLTGLSKNSVTTGKDDIKQFEIYYNYNIAENFTLTPSFQLLNNSGFDSSNSSYDNAINILSVRANYTF